MKEQTDNILVEQCLGGNTAAFGQIVLRYQKTVFNLAFGMTRDHDDAEDLAQTVFIKVYESLTRFNQQHKFYSWIYRITVNETLNFVKRNNRAVEIPESYESQDKSPEHITDDLETSAIIDSALDELAADYRILIVMRHFLNYSYSQISETLEMPEKTVKSRLYMARQILARILTQKGINVNG
jgi:RNA polymerase sigma-70 factor (ECF subfamily)